MKYTSKDYAKYNIDLSKCETFDDIIVATIEGNVKNGAPLDKHMFDLYVAIMTHDAIQDMLDTVLAIGNTINITNNGIEICKSTPIKLGKNEVARVENGEVVIRKSSLVRRFWNWITRKNK